MDSVATAQEVIMDCKNNKRQGVVLKLDFEKAYDKIEWSVVLDILAAWGFPNKWLAWIRDCITTAKASVLINGEHGNRILCRRGLRQGCPLSPLLFVMVSDILCRMIEAGEGAGFCKGIEGSGIIPKISILQYADDTLLFSNAEVNHIRNLKLILDLFCQMTGLRINYDKSSLILLEGEEQFATELANLLGCKVERLPFKYLGIPIKVTRLSKQDVAPVIEKMEKRLAGWKSKILSRGGRLTLINSTLSTIPTYLMSFYKFPKWAIKEMDKIRRNFFWANNQDGKGIHTISWKSICRPLDMGGLGLIDVGRRVWPIFRRKRAGTRAARFTSDLCTYRVAM